MGHHVEFGYMQWATTKMKTYSKSLQRFPHYGPKRRIWLRAMGQNTVFGNVLHAGRSTGLGFALWAIAQEWVCAMGHTAKPITECRSPQKIFMSLPYPLKNIIKQGLFHPGFKSLVSAKNKFGSQQWPIAQSEFRIRITQRIRNGIKKT